MILHKIRDKDNYKKMWRWSKKNLFSSPVNVIISFVLLYLAALIFFRLIEWAFLDATFLGNTKDSCALNDGACWPFIKTKFRFFLFGFYPKQWMWRPILYLILTLCSMLFLFSSKQAKNRAVIYVGVTIGLPILTFALLRGWGSFTVSPEQWGGLLLTVVLAILCLLLSFPIGVVLAFARAGKFKPIKIFAIIIIEFFRGIPFVTILFMSAVVVPLFFPAEVITSKIVRLIIGMTLFEAAYLAEVLRGGLQAVPKGQIEAAQSLGLPWWTYTYFIVLPQALRVSLANITSISIAFIKDTSLVLIVGWFDLLGIVKPLSSDHNWLGTEPEGYLFVGVVFWILCVFASRIGTKLEKEGNYSTHKL